VGDHALPGRVRHVLFELAADHDSETLFFQYGGMTSQPSANKFRSAMLAGKAGCHDDLVVNAKKARVDRSAAGLTGVPVSRQERRRQNQRARDRHRLTDEKAVVRVAKRKHAVELINLSGGGAMIEGNLKLALWDSVDLQLGENGKVECAVRWIRAKRFGLEFAHETQLDCDADERASVLREVISRSFADVAFAPAPGRDVSADGEETQPDVAAADELRRAKRHPLIWTGSLHHDYQTSPIRIRNISGTGAMIECAAPVRVGTEPLLELSDALSISGTVEWVVGDHFGLRFHSPFDLADLAQSRPGIAPTDWIRPAYLESEATPDSPWDPRWNRMSVGELRQELEGFLKH
jgi:hypothetical protein